jgi:beta-lactamase regulating signal transducer with metallopeptidase domain
VDTLLHVGLSNAVLATALAVAAAAVSRVCRGRPAVAHSLWLLVLLKLLTPPLLTLRVPWPDRAASVPEVPVPASAPTDAEPVDAGNLAPPAEEDLAPPAEPAAPTSPVSLPVDWWKPALMAVWLGGALLWWGAVAVRLCRFRRCWRCARPAPAAVQERARQLARRLGLARCPGVWLLPAPVGPLLWAVAGPARVLLPADLWGGLNEDQRDTLLAHELAHLRRGDPWVRRLELLALGLYWWHPVAWWARRRLQEAEEECCDAWVVWALPDAADAYAEALLRTVRYLSQADAALPAGASGAGQVRLLKRRLSMIVQGTTPRGLSRAGLAAVVLLAAVLLPLLPTRGLTEPPADDPPPVRVAPPAAPTPAAPTAVTPPPTLPPTTRALPADYPTNLEEALDAVELLRAQLQAKKADVAEALVQLKRAKRKLARMEELSRKGAVEAGVVDDAQSDVALQEARLSGKEALLREAEVRLRQAEHRLSRLRSQSQRPAPEARPGPAPRVRNRPDTAGGDRRAAPDLETPRGRPAPDPLLRTTPPTPELSSGATLPAGAANGRIDNLEKKLDTLLREVEQLRREMRSREGGRGFSGRARPPAVPPPAPAGSGELRDPPAPRPVPPTPLPAGGNAVPEPKRQG